MSTGLLVAALLAAGPAEDGRADVATTVVPLVGEDPLLALRDLDGDGDLDLLFVEEDGIGARFLQPDGTYADRHDAWLEWPGPHVGWCLADIDADGAIEVVCLIDGREVRVYEPWPGEDELLDEIAGEGRPHGRKRFADRMLLEVRGHVPRGVHRMSFLRDVDGDGSLDLVVPASDHYEIHRRGEGDSWLPPLSVRLETDVDYDVGDPEELDSEFGQRVRIPWFTLEDVDGDGTLDLIAETDDAVLFHLATPELSDEPTWRLDLADLRGELRGEDEVDFDDLLAQAGQQVSWRVIDLDGEGANDLVIRIGAKIRVHREGSLAGPDETPDQVLKSSGNVLYFVVRDVQGDELPDLQIVRGEEISLSRVLRWLILPGELDFDVYTYRNEGGVFSRKPTRRNTLTIEFPRLFSFVEQLEELEERLEEEEPVPARRAVLDGDGVADDILDVRGAELLVWHDRAPAEEGRLVNMVGGSSDDILEEMLFRELDPLEDGGTRTIDLGDVDAWTIARGVDLREATAGVEPDRRIALEVEPADPLIHVQDLDRDGRPDFLVAGNDGEQRMVVQLVVDRAAR